MYLVLVVVGLFIYGLAVSESLLTGQHVCNKHTVILSIASVVFILLGFLSALIFAIAKRSIRIGFHSVFIALLALLLYFVFYLLATQCPGW